MEHYFTPSPEALSRPCEVPFELGGRAYTFRSDRSVFARTRVDKGSRLLVETVDATGARSLLDWGCGYGVLGLVLADRFPGLRVTLIDVNARAAELARANAARMGIEGIRVLVSDGYAQLAGERFHVIVSNPPVRAGKQVLWGLIEGAPAHLHPGGSLWLVQLTRQGAKSTLKKMEEVFGAAETVERGSGYRVLKAVRPDA